MDVDATENWFQDASALARPHRRTSSSSSLLTKIPSIWPPADERPQHEIRGEETHLPPATAPAATVLQRKTRRRRGSLRKVALLSKGAQRDRREGRPLTVDTSRVVSLGSEPTKSPPTAAMANRDALGLVVGGDPEWPPLADDQPGSGVTETSILPSPIALSTTCSTAVSTGDRDEGRPNSYNWTTDEEDLISIHRGPMLPRTASSLSSGSDSYFGKRTTGQPARSFQQVKSPLSYSGISTAALSPPNSDWDYSETEWWGWVVLTVTWFVFVIGMGSCLNVWSWAWDVGKTPYAPPELEDDPTLPIVGYYPALIIMTGVMAWVWVVVAWVGMKYFRHAKISGD